MANIPKQIAHLVSRIDAEALRLEHLRRKRRCPHRCDRLIPIIELTVRELDLARIALCRQHWRGRHERRRVRRLTPNPAQARRGRLSTRPQSAMAK